MKYCQPQTEPVIQQQSYEFPDDAITQFYGRDRMAPIQKFYIQYYKNRQNLEILILSLQSLKEYIRQKTGEKQFYHQFTTGMYIILQLSFKSIKNMKIFQCVCLLLLLLAEVMLASIDIDAQFPQLKIDKFSYASQESVNVTIGQNFAIGVPQFDIDRVPDDLKIYEISQQKFINMFQTLEKHRNGNSQNQTRKQVDKNIFQCSIKSPNMEIVRTLNVYNKKSSSKFSYSSQESIIYIVVDTQQLLYSLDTENMQLSVYHYTSQKLNFLSSQSISNQKNHKSLVMGKSSNQQQIYLFSNQGMWSIKTKTVLTNVQKISNLNGYNSVQYPLDKLYNGGYGYLFGIKRHSAVYLIPQQKGSVNKFTIIDKYGNITIIPQDLSITGRKLYILDLHQGVYIYSLLGNGQVQQHDHIIFESYANIKLLVYYQTIFIRYSTQQSQNIIEINYDQEKHSAHLVRYYKNDQIVNKMMTARVPVFSAHQNYMSVEQLLFLINDNGEIQVYPFNVDPRVINQPHNGAKIHIDGVNQIISLYEDIYIVATTNNLLYVKIRIQKPELQCKMQESTGHIYYQIQYSTNISTCQSYSKELQHKKSYSSNCQIVSNYMIYVNDPDLSRFQKGLLYGIVLLVLSSFVLGMLCLIQWRNNQLSLIGRIKDEILKLRDRYRKMQPFTQQEPEHNHNKNQVQFELPQSLPIPDQS